MNQTLMQIHRYKNSLPLFNNSVVTVGSFDGVHLGHQAIINAMVSMADTTGYDSVLVTFNPHPRLVLHQNDEPLLVLQTESEKEKIIAQTGIHHLVSIPFTHDFANQSAIEYINNFLINDLGMKVIIVGYDHTFGKNKTGNISTLLAENNNRYKVIQIEKQQSRSIDVSSTKIRNALLTGDLITAKSLLGRHYSIEGFIIQGNQIGRTLGYATANVAVDFNKKVVPKDGVYLVKIIESNFSNVPLWGMCNIGKRPTVAGLEQRLEVHIFDFDATIYDAWMQVVFIERLRDEVKFESIAYLQQQLQNDEATCRIKIANQ